MNNINNVLNKISFHALFVVIVLLPLFVLPFTSIIYIETTKGLLLVVGLTVAIVSAALRLFFDKDNYISFPKSKIFYAGLVVLLISFFSALSSVGINNNAAWSLKGTSVSFFGSMLDIGSFFFLLASFALMFMSSALIDVKKSGKLFIGIMISSAVLIVFQTLHLFYPAGLSLGILQSAIDTIFGPWSSFGFFAGFLVIASLMFIEFFLLSVFVNIVLILFTILSLFVIATVGFTSSVWILLAIFSAIIFFLKVRLSSEIRKKALLFSPSLIVFIISILFIISFISLSTRLTNPERAGKPFSAVEQIARYFPIKLKTANLNQERRPSLIRTINMFEISLFRDPLLGVGPNRFSEISTAFDNSNYDVGSGLLPTIMLSTGYLGLLSWVWFLYLFIIASAKTSLKNLISRFNNIVVDIKDIYFLSALYLLIVSFIHRSGAVMFLLLFAFIGIFVRLLSSSDSEESDKNVVDVSKKLTLSLSGSPVKKFTTAVVLVVIILLCLFFGYIYLRKFFSIPFFHKAISTISVVSKVPVGDIDKLGKTINEARGYIEKALKLHKNDIYLRFAVDIESINLEYLNYQINSQKEHEAQRIEFNEGLKRVGKYSIDAVNYNPSNYLNYKTLGFIQQVPGTSDSETSFNSIESTYKKMLVLNPYNAELRFITAKTYFAYKRFNEAKIYAKQALIINPEYLEAILLLYNISKTEKDIYEAAYHANTAISILNNALSNPNIDPDNQELIKKLINEIGNDLKSLNINSNIKAESISNTAKEDNREDNKEDKTKKEDKKNKQ